MSLVTLIPEPDKKENVVENGLKTDKKNASNSSTDKSNLSGATVAKKGTRSSSDRANRTLSLSVSEGDDQFSMDM